MNTLVSLSLVAAVLLATSASLSGAQEQRQGRALSGSGAVNYGSSNSIEHSSAKSHLDAEDMKQGRQQVAEFFTAKNIVKSMIKLLFGNQSEVRSTSKQALGILNMVLDKLKNSFGPKSRGAHYGRTIRDTAEDVASAGVTILQGYVKSLLTDDERCTKRYLCQASKDATREGRELGYLVATVGGYASSYLLDEGNNRMAFKNYHEASQKGRGGVDCEKEFVCGALDDGKPSKGDSRQS